MERAVSYWLCPALDPRVRAWSSRDSFIADNLRQKGVDRGDEGPRGIAKALGISVPAAVKIATSLVDKLFVRTHLPNQAALRKFVAEMSRAVPERQSVLRAADKLILPLQQTDTGRFLSALELFFLFHEKTSAAASFRGRFASLARELSDVGFALEDTNQPPTTETLARAALESLRFIGSESRELARAAADYLSEFTTQLESGQAGSSLES